MNYQPINNMTPKDNRFKQFIIDNKAWCLGSTIPYFSGVVWAELKEGEDEQAYLWYKTDRDVKVKWHRLERLFMRKHLSYRGMGKKKLAKLAEFMVVEYGTELFKTLKAMRFDREIMTGW